MCRELRAHAFRRIAAQGDNVLDTGIKIIIDHAHHFDAGRTNTGEVRGRGQAGFLDHALYGPVRAVAC